MDSSSVFDSNFRPIKVRHDPDLLPENLPGRIGRCAIPFLCMYPPTERLVSIGLGGIQAVYKLQEAQGEFRSGHYGQAAFKGTHAVSITALVVLGLFRPRTAMLLGLVQQLAESLKTWGQKIARGEKSEACEQIGQLAYDLLYLTSLWCQRADLLFLSLTLQAIVEMRTSRQAFRQGRYLEGLSHLVLSLVKAHGAKLQGVAAHREWFGRDLTQEEFDRIYQEIIDNWRDLESPGPVDLDQVLARQNFRGRLENLNLNFRNFGWMRFRNLHISKTSFQNSWFKHASFEGTNVENCDFSGCQFLDARFRDSTFRASTFHEAVFSRSVFDRVEWRASDFHRAHFGHTQLRAVEFEASQLLETNFFRAHLRGVRFNACDLTDTLFFDNKAHVEIFKGQGHRITRPVVAFLWNFDGAGYFASLEMESLREEGVIVAKLDYHPNDVDPSQLDNEVRAGLVGLTALDFSEVSRPQALLERCRADGHIRVLRDIGDEIARHCQGILLPGGADIEPELYGQAPSWRTATESDFRRSMLEAALYRAARREQIPLWGICRGSQAIGVNAGGRLVQHVEDHLGVFHQLSPPTDAPDEVWDKLEEIFGNGELLSPSFHHQALTEVPQGFRALLRHRDVMKVMISDDELVLATQVHPEIFRIWDMQDVLEMEVRIDPSKLNVTELGMDIQLWLARLRDQDVRRPFDVERDAPMRGRNRKVFSYFVKLVHLKGRLLDGTHDVPSAAMAIS